MCLLGGILEVKKWYRYYYPTFYIGLWSLQMLHFLSEHHILIKRPRRGKLKDDFMFFLENSSFSYVNVDPILRDIDMYILDMLNSLPMCQLFLYLRSLTRYQVRMLLFLLILLISILLLILILNLILIFQLLTVMERGVAFCIHCITSWLMHNFPHNVMFLFPPLILILFPSLFQMPCQI